MKCPVCGGKLKVHHTENGSTCIVRFRKCEKCGATVKTIEEISGD